MKNRERKRRMLVLGLAMVLGGAVVIMPVAAHSQATQNQQDITNWQLAAFDRFLDRHPDIAKDLAGRPWLVNNTGFVKKHHDLQAFLKDHPELREELKGNPSLFMQRERQFEGTNQDRDLAPVPNPKPGNPDLTQGQIADFDHFLDQHPDIAKQLEKNPSLMSNQEFVENNAQLQAFLTSHPQVREEFNENPSLFMQRQRQFEGTSQDRDRVPAPNPKPGNPDLTQGQIGDFDHFLDQHPDVAKQLETKPSLLNDKAFLKKHHDLEVFLKDHPELREEVKENPSLFMQREQQFERSSAAGEGVRPNPNPDLNEKEIAALDQFMDKHPDIASQLSANPALVNDKGFLKKHHDLEAFLKGHPELREEFKESPSYVMQREARNDRDAIMRHRDDRHSIKNRRAQERHENEAREHSQKGHLKMR